MSQANRRRSRSRWPQRLAAISVLLLAATTVPAVAVQAAPAPKAEVSAAVRAAVAGGGSTGFLVYLRDRADLSPAASAASSTERATRVYTALTATAATSQRDVRALLDDRKVSYRSFWIANALLVTGDQSVVDALAAEPSVASIAPSKTYPLVQPIQGTDQATVNAVEWGLDNIKAPQVWSEYGVRGEGIVVANIDSGVQYDHPALVGKYRGNTGGTFSHDYNWFDPTGICTGGTPCDNNDHGTHTMGTMVGDDGAGNVIGVAPGAKWIAAKGCEVNTCSDASLLAAAQWVLAPTDRAGNNPRPDLHPDVVNNSWGGSGGDLWYEDSVDAWIAAGIFPMFSNGNEGPNCGTAGSPGDYPQSYSAGAYNSGNVIAGFSSRGASEVDGGIKPNIAAPGVNVRSSVPGGGYDSFSGTSMASPHVAGTVALLWSAAPALKGDIDATKALLDDTAVDVDSLGCGGTVDDNNNFGEGRLDAYAAVTAAPRGPHGTVTGTVTDAATGTVLAGATVSVPGRTVTTAANGSFELSVPAGANEVTASKYGYHASTQTVTVAEDATVTQNFALTPAPMVTVSGKVTDGSGHGYPLYARLDVAGGPGVPVFTDPFTGRYSVNLPGNATYQFSTAALYPGYRTATTPVVLAAAAKTVNIAVGVDPGCTAAGYASAFTAPLLSQDFGGGSLPAGWTANARTADGNWSFTDAGARGNLTGGTGGFAILDSDNLGQGKTQDADLITPVVDLSGSGAPYLRFNSDYRAFSNSIADVDVSTDGTTWTNVWHQTTTNLRGPRVEQIALTSLAGSATARIRFHYKGTWAWWWQVDNVEVVNRTCSPVPGGLVAGLTTDANTGAGLNGVTVTSTDVPGDKATSAATPDDAALADGFYWLFSTVTGTHPFAATKAPYAPLSKSVAVAADGIKRADFALKSGRLTISPTTVQSFQPYNSTRKTTLTVTNTGSAAATVQVLERGGDFSILGRAGAPLMESKLPGGKAPRGMTGVAGTRPAASTPAAAGAWAPIADYPVEVFDNAAAALEGKVYSVGGGSGTGNENKAFRYDPATGAWAALPNLPTGRAKPQVAAVGGKLYVLGGWNGSGTPISSVDVFDPVAGTWSTLSGVINPKPRSAAGIAVANGKIILVGGCTDSSCTDSTDTVIFDPSANVFTLGAAYPQGVAWMSCGGVSGKVYCAGGSGDADFDNGFAYDPAANSWSPIADMPFDLWGSAGTSAGGLLVLAGGVTDGSTTVTNKTIAYDPAANAWLTLPNAANAVYRAGAACGAYKIGGSPTSFVGSKKSEFLGDLGQCDEATEVTWLSENPASFTLAAGKSRTITVTLTATPAAGVQQPGKYEAQLALRSDTPYPVSGVDVEMNVSPPPNWGKIQGTVLGQSCAGGLVGVPAIVRVNLLDIPDTGWTLRAGADGSFAYWVPKGNYEVIVAKDGWIPEATRLKIEAGIVRTADFTLDPLDAC
ncbi:hypothetical protein Cs7R123_30300 [Catellatospora sp. TT07R-123]|uniref:S8 family serine peptidase n=1 Tax=Catellatospora sp. TT07R-123 TaxID=2733863 RepID=UPI001B1DA22F|nr:S8 family serine peptidase [Catellatospora sp. TT07R-123]GHJ45688.1 hypothetical protein Cs7R123_30300 [Catellatospora sp. TT07R-123]